MSNCCHNKEKELAHTAQEHRKVLWIVLLINMLMFGVELFSGLISDSTALIGDSLDMFGDSVTYASSLFVVGMAFSAKAKVARLKAYIMILFGGAILARSVHRMFFQSLPDYDVMFLIGALALTANLICRWRRFITRLHPTTSAAPILTNPRLNSPPIVWRSWRR